MAVKKETLKRHIINYKSKDNFATHKYPNTLPNIVHKYSSYLIKEGKDIDPTLQHNKAFNISLSASKINKVIIHPGEIFSFWNLVGKINKMDTKMGELLLIIKFKHVWGEDYVI